MIETFDNFFDNNLYQQFLEEFWQHDNWEAKHNKNNYSFEPRRWNWNRSLGKKVDDGNSLDISQLPSLHQDIINAVTERIKMLTGRSSQPLRYYSNSHTYGIDGPIHHDDGDVTAIFYPHDKWTPEWEGGTAIYNKDKTQCLEYVTVQPNRLLLFDASLPHRAMPLTRECYEIRASVVIKNRFI